MGSVVGMSCLIVQQEGRHLPNLLIAQGLRLMAGRGCGHFGHRSCVTAIFLCFAAQSSRQPSAGRGKRVGQPSAVSFQQTEGGDLVSRKPPAASHQL